MRRLLAVLALMLVGTVAAAPPLSAQDGSSTLNRKVSGPFTGTTSWRFFGDGCSFVHQVFDATYDTGSGREGTFHLDVCVNNRGTSTFPVTGTFVLTARNGAALTGTVTGTITSVSVEVCFANLDFALTTTDGTRNLRRASGTVNLDGTWNCQNPGVISGLLAGALQRLSGTRS
jgi:hypothetical protein